MSKSNPINDKLLSKTNIAIVCMIAMIAGFLFSRAVLSVSMMVLGVVVLWNISPKRWLQHKWWLLGVGWVGMYALTYFWCDDKAYWGRHMEVKLPILLLPLTFSFLPSFNTNQLRAFTFFCGLLLLGGVLYSTYPLFSHLDYYISQYHVAHTLPTPAENDHIRFSLCIDLFIVWCAYIWPKVQGRAIKILLAFLIATFSVYLHLLAARTGLLLWYLFIVLLAVYIGIRKKPAIGLALVFSITVTGFLLAKNIPTLSKRINYQFYTYQRYKEGDKTGNYSDIGRLISYDIAIKHIKQHPITGVGTGDMMAEMKNGYARWYPEVDEERQLLPHNQFLIVALACGIPASVLFILWVLTPLWLLRLGSMRDKFFFFIVWISTFLPLLFEPMLEIQFGLFVYLFFLLLQKHMLKHASKIEA